MKRGIMFFYTLNSARKAAKDFRKFVGKPCVLRNGRTGVLESITVDPSGFIINVKGVMQRGYYVICRYKNGPGEVLRLFAAYNQLPYDPNQYEMYGTFPWNPFLSAKYSFRFKP